MADTTWMLNPELQFVNAAIRKNGSFNIITDDETGKVDLAYTLGHRTRHIPDVLIIGHRDDRTVDVETLLEYISDMWGTSEGIKVNSAYDNSDHIIYNVMHLPELSAWCKEHITKQTTDWYGDSDYELWVLIPQYMSEEDVIGKIKARIYKTT